MTGVRRLPSIAAALGAALLLASGPAARAAEGLYLTWDECALSGLANHNRVNICSSNIGGQDLFVAFRLAQPADSVLGLEIVVDVQHADAVMPDWWQLGSGGCRSGALVPSFDFSIYTTCADFMGGQAAGGLQGYFVGQPRGGANQARIKMAAAFLPSVGYATLNADDLYYGARMNFQNIYTVAPGPVCAGCPDAACLVLNSIWVKRQPGAIGGDVYVTVPGPGNANFATWQGGAGADCAAVPVRPVTWGRVKSLYR